MESKTDIAGETGADSQRPGDVGIFQSMGLGLLAFTILMAVMGIVLTMFVDLGD